MNNKTGDVLRKRELEQCYFAIYCITTKINIENIEGYAITKKLYTFFGCTMEGKKKYISSILDTEVEKTSGWYNFFQGLKKRNIEHILYSLLPNNKELRDAIKLSFPRIEIFTSCENVIDKLQRYNSYRTKDEIYREVRKLYVAKDLIEYELSYKEFKEKFSKYPFIMEMLNEEIKSLKDNYRYSFSIRRIIYAFNYIIQMKKRFGVLYNHDIYKTKDEFIDKCAYALFMSESATHYYKDEWTLIINEIYEDKKDLIKPYL